MFALVDPSGNYATGKTGNVFQYGTRQMAVVAARILGKRDGVHYKVIPA